MIITFCLLGTSTVPQIKLNYIIFIIMSVFKIYERDYGGHSIMVTMVTRGARCVPSQVGADWEEAVEYTIENSSNLSKE